MEVERSKRRGSSETRELLGGLLVYEDPLAKRRMREKKYRHKSEIASSTAYCIVGTLHMVLPEDRGMVWGRSPSWS